VHWEKIPGNTCAFLAQEKEGEKKRLALYNVKKVRWSVKLKERERGEVVKEGNFPFEQVCREGKGKKGKIFLSRGRKHPALNPSRGKKSQGQKLRKPLGENCYFQNKKEGEKKERGRERGKDGKQAKLLEVTEGVNLGKHPSLIHLKGWGGGTEKSL